MDSWLTEVGRWLGRVGWLEGENLRMGERSEVKQLTIR